MAGAWSCRRRERETCKKCEAWQTGSPIAESWCLREVRSVFYFRGWSWLSVSVLRVSKYKDKTLSVARFHLANFNMVS